MQQTRDYGYFFDPTTEKIAFFRKTQTHIVRNFNVIDLKELFDSRFGKRLF